MENQITEHEMVKAVRAKLIRKDITNIREWLRMQAKLMGII